MNVELVPPVRRSAGDGCARYDSAFRHVLDPVWDRLASSEATAFGFSDGECTFVEIGRMAAGVADGLLGVGVGVGEPVVVCGRPGRDWVAGAFGTLAAGAALMPLDPKLTPAELERMVSRTGARAQLRLPGSPTIPGLELVDPAADSSGLPRRGEADDVAVILHTSGSSGVPKAVELTHDNLVQSLHSFVDVFGCSAVDRTCIAVPLFHVTGLVDQLLHLAWVGGYSRVLETYSTEAMVTSLVEDEVTFMVAVPTVFALLTRQPPSERLALRLAVYGGSPIGRPTVDALVALVPGIRPVQGYGMTEMTSLATALPLDVLHEAPMSVGVPSPITDLRVVDEAGCDRLAGEIGEIVMRGPHRTRGYRGDPEATAAAIDAGGWLHSGDLGWLDDRGLLYLAGRRGEIINRAGEKISPREVEGVLCDVPGVEEAVVFSMPDEILFEVPAAAVVVGESLTLARLHEALDRGLARFKHPVAILRLPAIPLGANGKPDLKVLRGLVAEASREGEPHA